MLNNLDLNSLVREPEFGRGENPVPLRHDSEVIRMRGCPDCDGRGYFLINPFGMGGSNGAGGLGNMCQCQTCFNAKKSFDEYGRLPPEILTRQLSRLKAAVALLRDEKPHELIEAAAGGKSKTMLVDRATFVRLATLFEEAKRYVPMIESLHGIDP